MSLPPPLPGIASFHTDPDRLTRLRIATPLATAEIALQGAHITHFQPTGAAPVLFMSHASHFTPGKPIRGGVPVCFPWFGARSGRADSPAHGFARIMPWEVETLTGSSDRGVTAVFRLASNEETRAHWPYDFLARLRVEITRRLAITLEVENTSSVPLQFEEALHTYFAVSDIRNVSITGLESARYLDKVDHLQTKQLSASPLRIAAETDWVFSSHEATCVIDDPASSRRITVEKSGSQTTVVWNPWVAKAAAMPDFGDDEWPRMLCIETANTAPDAITLAPGARHSMTATISLD